MNVSLDAVKTILGIKSRGCLNTRDMARRLKITFLPPAPGASSVLTAFARALQKTLSGLGAQIIPFEQSFTMIKDVGRKIRPGIVVFAVGDCETGKLPIDYTYSFTNNPIVTLLDRPPELQPRLSAREFMQIGLRLFTWHMSNVVICVDAQEWMMFSFNGFSPFYPAGGPFAEFVLSDFVPKIATRVFPPQMQDFKLIKTHLNFMDTQTLQPFMKDIVESGPAFAASNLFWPMNRLDSFSYRTDFYKWAASLHLDERSGMSYGFISRQLPVKLPVPIPYRQAQTITNGKKLARDLFLKDQQLYLALDIQRTKYILEVPQVWVLMSRSGSEKTRLDPYRDILKIGLANGQMYMEIPPGIDITEDYKPSFDTRVILSHCVANALYAAALRTANPDAQFPRILEEKGTALVHWHGQILPELVPLGWFTYGSENPPVLCSSSQAAIFAFKGKETAVDESIHLGIEFLGDIHVEPQHGINISWETLAGLGKFLASHSLLTPPR